MELSVNSASIMKNKAITIYKNEGRELMHKKCFRCF